MPELVQFGAGELVKVGKTKYEATEAATFYGTLAPANDAKTQTTRMVKVSCPRKACGDGEGNFYTVRMTRKWLEKGAPFCPTCEKRMHVDGESLEKAKRDAENEHE